MSKTKVKRKKKQMKSPYLAVVKNDPLANKRIEPADVVRALGLLPHARTLDYNPIGPLGCCYGNAYVTAELCGGKMVVGWLIAKDGIARRLESQNRLARMCLYTHAVWQAPDGRLMEVTEGLRHTRFVPDGTLGICGGGHIEFPDDYATARRVIAERTEDDHASARWSIVWIRKETEQSIGGLRLAPGRSLAEYHALKTRGNQSEFWKSLELAV